MLDILLHNVWVHLYVLYLTAWFLVVFWDRLRQSSVNRGSSQSQRYETVAEDARPTAPSSNHLLSQCRSGSGERIRK
jgi:hypothetical protein